MKAALFLLVLIVLPCIALADELDDLIENLNIYSEIRNSLESCREGAVGLLAKEFEFEIQSDRLGLDRGDSDWVSLAAIYDEFYRTACDYITPEEVTKIYRIVYSKKLSSDEIKQSNKFYSSDLGRKLVRLNSEAQSLVNELINENAAEKTFAAQRVFELRLEEFERQRELKQYREKGESKL